MPPDGGRAPKGRGSIPFDHQGGPCADGKAPAGIKERLLRTWLAYKRLTGLSFPRRFPIVQFPNLPLIVAVLAGEAGKFLDGGAHSFAVSVSYLAITIWAYEELVYGVNWFRRLLGLAYVILLVVRVAGALHA